MFVICILEVSGSNHVGIPVIPTAVFHGARKFFDSDVEIVPEIRLLPLFFFQFVIHKSPYHSTLSISCSNHSALYLGKVKSSLCLTN
jgi:hypothetical protein